ncbi:MAG: hypothetical protein COA57_15855 [Flavobacteriales bacterium]|nr:MAG: hypothetical protein COA57_15855 [Flavobacteriales bacterium]
MKNSTILSGFLVPPPIYYFTAIGIAMAVGVFFEINQLLRTAFWTVLGLLIFVRCQQQGEIKSRKYSFQNLTLYFNNSVMVRVFSSPTFVI